MGLQINNYNSRLGFDTAKQLLMENGLDPTRAVLSQSVIRSEVVMSTTVTNYHLPILSNDTQNGANTNTSILLDLQDVFLVSQIGLFVAAPSSATSTEFELFAYGAPSVFTTSTSAKAICACWNTAPWPGRWSAPTESGRRSP